MKSIIVTSPAAPPSLPTSPDGGPVRTEAGHGDLARSLSDIAAAGGVALAPRTADTAARLISPQQHPAYAALEIWLLRAISPITAARLAEFAQAVAGARLELIALRGRSSFDVVQEIGAPLWPDLLAAWTGLADQQRRRLHHLRHALGALSDPRRLTPRGIVGVAAALDELRRIFGDAYRYPRFGRSLPNLFTTLETRWTPALGPIEDEVVLAATQLLFHGSGASASVMGPLVDMLMQRPRQLARLRANPSFVTAFVDDKEAALSRRRTGPDGAENKAAPFERILRPVAKIQATAVVKALLCARAPVEADRNGRAVWTTRHNGTRQLDHLVLRFDV